MLGYTQKKVKSLGKTIDKSDDLNPMHYTKKAKLLGKKL